MDEYDVVLVKRRYVRKQKEAQCKGQCCDNCDKPLRTKKEKKEGMCTRCLNSLQDFLKTVHQ